MKSIASGMRHVVAQSSCLLPMLALGFAFPIFPAPAGDWLAPSQMTALGDGRTLFVTCAKAQRLLRFDIEARRISSAVEFPESLSGVALSADGERLFVSFSEDRGSVRSVALEPDGFGAVSNPIATGHGSQTPVLSLDGKTLYVCNRFDHDVSVIDLASGQQIDRIPVVREPVAADITKDGKFLLVANHLPSGRSDAGYVAAAITVIDLTSHEVCKELHLPDGSTDLKGLRVSPDGKFAAVTHLVARHRRPAAHLYMDWMNANALTLIDLNRMEVFGSVLLDDRGKGAANPWGLAWTADGTTLVVAHAGTHELSVIDFTDLVRRIGRLPAPLDLTDPSVTAKLSPQDIDTANYTPFFPGKRQRVKLPPTDLGPRSVAVIGRTAYVANYFSDTLSIIDLSQTPATVESVPLGPKPEMTQARKGEFYFHDATICLQGWQSCASCHPEGRADGLNWDLLNDGVGNPKNTKSILLTFQTPPAMSLGVRDTAETAIRSGLRHILFTDQPEAVPAAIGAYLSTLRPMPSPHLVEGRLSQAAERGKAVFARAGCAACHPPGRFTDLRAYDVGTRNSLDKSTDKFDTPTLIELWRTAPYLHDGSAATIRDVVVTRNLEDRHGVTSKLSSVQVADLCAYLLSL